MTPPEPPHAPRRRWPATPAAWLLLTVLQPVAALAGFAFGLVGPFVWIALWLLPV